MEQGSLADLLTLAKSGDSNKFAEMMAASGGMYGGQQWMWWLLIILFAFGGYGNGAFGRGNAVNWPNSAATSDTFQIMDRINATSSLLNAQTQTLSNGLCTTTYELNNSIRDVRDAMASCCCETNLNLEKMKNQVERGQDMLSHQIADCCCQTQLRMQDLATGIREQATANQFANQQEFCNIKTQMAANQCETLAAIQANQAAIIGYMTQEKIANLERENAALAMQLSQNAQTRTIIDALKPASTAA